MGKFRSLLFEPISEIKRQLRLQGVWNLYYFQRINQKWDMIYKWNVIMQINYCD